jgi:hypothetical protein
MRIIVHEICKDELLETLHENFPSNTFKLSYLNGSDFVGLNVDADGYIIELRWDKELIDCFRLIHPLDLETANNYLKKRIIEEIKKKLNFQTK